MRAERQAPNNALTINYHNILVGGSGIKKRGVATTHRDILRCLTQLGFEVLSVAMTQSIASKTGPSFSLRGSL